MKHKSLTIFKEVKITISPFFSNFAFDSVRRALNYISEVAEEPTDKTNR